MADCNNLGQGTGPGLLYKTKLQINGVKVTSVPDLVLEKYEDITSASSVVSIMGVKKAPVISMTEERKENEEIEKPSIQNWLGEEILGQHGGELLLAWNSVETEYVPGMIVVGTKVIGPGVVNKKQVEKHRATIYYSEPKDTLVKEDRNILIQSIMRLNN